MWTSVLAFPAEPSGMELGGSPGLTLPVLGRPLLWRVRKGSAKWLSAGLPRDLETTAPSWLIH